MEADVVILRPPVAKFSGLIVLPSRGIERVGNLVSDHDADVPEFFLAGHGITVKIAAQNSGRNIDGIVERIIIGVDLLRGGDPLIPVDRLIDFRSHSQSDVSGDGEARFYETSACLRTPEIDHLCSASAGAVAERTGARGPARGNNGLAGIHESELAHPLFGTGNADREAVQFFDRL